jgi:phosphoglycolate phosphatase
MRSRFPRPCRLFLFDLDGTLIDSVPDIAASVNLALRRMRLGSLATARVADFVGEGVRRLIERSLREVLRAEPDEAQVAEAAALYLQEYSIHLLDSTRLFPGVAETLARLGWARMAVVSNKPEGLSKRILEALGVLAFFCTVIGGDSIPERKPDPAPLREAMRRCGASASDTVIVGDSVVDVRAGRAAGIVTCGIASQQASRGALAEAGCDLIVREISELPAYFHPAR